MAVSAILRQCTVMLLPTLLWSMSCSALADASFGEWGENPQLRDSSNVIHPPPPGGWYQAAVHAVLIPSSGKVIFTGNARENQDNCLAASTLPTHIGTFLFDPASIKTNQTVSFITTLDEDPDFDNNSVAWGLSHSLYCAGHTLTDEGKAVFVGGFRTERWQMGTLYSGLDYAVLFDPIKATFSRSSYRSPIGRIWYGTAVNLGDDHILVWGGFSSCCSPSVYNNGLALYEPRKEISMEDPWTVVVPHNESRSDLAQAKWDYTRIFRLKRPVFANNVSYHVAMIGEPGRVVLLNVEDLHNTFLSSARFYAPPNGQRPGGCSFKSTSLMGPSGELVIVGGCDGQTAMASRIDIYNITDDSWRSVETGIVRHHAASIMLPDATMLIINGVNPNIDHSSNPLNIVRGDPRTSQLYNFETGEITNLTAEPGGPFRGYHSTGLLLKDGRVLISGGIITGPGCEWPDVHFFLPPYLSSGSSRPSFVAVSEPALLTGTLPLEIRYSGSLKSDSGVVLMASGSFTHGFDSNQRYIALDIVQHEPGISVTVRVPTHEYVRPGQYTMFLVSSQGTPSFGLHTYVKAYATFPHASAACNWKREGVFTAGFVLVLSTLIGY